MRCALLWDRQHYRGGVVPGLDAAAVAGDLAVGEEAGDRHLAHHAADGVDLPLEAILEDQAAADAVEEQDAGRALPLEVLQRFLCGLPRGGHHRVRLAVEDRYLRALRHLRGASERPVLPNRERSARGGDLPGSDVNGTVCAMSVTDRVRG